MTLRRIRGQAPRLHPTAFVEASAQIIGDVEIGEGSSVWFNCVVRGDVNPIRVGARTNIQDLSLVHVQSRKFGTTLGDDVTVGHHVVLHGCTLGSRVLVGMGAILMDGVEVGSDCIVGAGTLLTPGTKVPDGSLVVGSPGKVRRALTDDERAFLLTSAQNYVAYAKEYREGLSPVDEE
jgi:carbonic anhydrase/acetyltransferase-like protein (isoleucine patch superfamily)